MGLLDPILGGATGLVQSGIDYITQKRNTDRTIEANKNLAEYQYSKDLEMWNRANEYNSPVKQMERYKAAGLNPNLIYGSGGSAGNTATSLPKYQAPTVRYDYEPAVNLPAALSLYNDFRVQNARVDNIKAQTEAQRSLNTIRLLDAVDKRAKNWFNFGGEDYDFKKLDFGSDFGYRAANSKLNAQRKLSESQANVVSATVKDRIDKVRRENQLLDSHIRLNNINTAYRAKDVNWYTGKALSDMVTKAVGAFGIGSIARNIGRKKATNNNTYYKVDVGTGEIRH